MTVQTHLFRHQEMRQGKLRTHTTAENLLKRSKEHKRDIRVTGYPKLIYKRKSKTAVMSIVLKQKHRRLLEALKTERLKDYISELTTKKYQIRFV